MKKLALILALIFVTQNSMATTRYEIDFNSELVACSRHIALQQIGVKEIRKNRSIEIDKYNRSIPVALGSPYCASGQYYCYDLASYYLQVTNRMPRTAVANNFFKHFQKYGKRTQYIPQVDDFIVWNYPNSWKGHIERIIEVKKGGFVKTIAFNVSAGNENSNDGKDGVMYKVRNIKHPLFRMRVRGICGVNKNAI